MTEEPPRGSLRPTSALTLVGWGVVGAAGGWALHRLYDRLDHVPPLVPWVQPGTLWLLAAILGWTALATYRSRARGDRMTMDQAVNRLVLARASALVCALVGAGYLGYGLSWVGDAADLADQRLVRCLVAAGAGLAGMIAALLLERACRVRGDD